MNQEDQACRWSVRSAELPAYIGSFVHDTIEFV